MVFKLKFDSERYWKVKEALEQISDNPADAVWELINR